MTAPATRVLSVLSSHIGAENGIRIDQLARAVDLSERAVRRVVSELREDGYAVCAHPSSGYYMARTPAELEHCCQFLRERALHSLRLEARLRRIPLPDLIGQIKLPT